MKKEEIRPALEAALFMSNEPITARKLAKILKANTNSVEEIIKKLKEEYETENHGIHVLETNQGYQLKVKPDYTNLVRPLTPYQDLSRGLLKVLALVAYKQPITQSEIVKVIGNRTYDYVKKLRDRGLINTVKHGRTKALIATKEFANYFGLESTEDFKKFFEDMVRKDEKRDDKPGPEVSSERTEEPE